MASNKGGDVDIDIVIVKKEKEILFTINGKIDERGAEELKACFLRLNLSSVKNVIFDFAEVQHIGSAGIGKLLLFYKELSLMGGNIIIENTPETIAGLFKELKLDTIFKVESKGV